MHFGILQDLIADPRSTLMFLLLALPGRLLAISAHEAAHGWVANKCGDPTAKMLGRVTLNPLKHLDPLGIACMLLLGIGWAKPVPVNPRNFKNYRRDDILVSLAGITMNLILFLLGGILMYVVFGLILASVPTSGSSALIRTVVNGTPALDAGQYWYDLGEVIRYAYGASDLLVVPQCGQAAGYLYTMLVYFVLTNINLAVFNLIPIPPLDGYHVLNDTILRRSQLFANRRTQQIGMAVMMIALWTGVLGDALEFIVYDGIMEGVGRLAEAVFRLIGLL